MSKNKSGFTLIELLVVIAILAILASIGFVTFSGVQSNARDAKRKGDLQAIAKSLELYYLQNNSYPGGGWYLSNGGNSWIPGLTESGFMPNIPTDPRSNGGYPWAGAENYGYAYWSYACANYPSGKFYVLIALLENTSDNARNAIRDIKWCDNNGLTSVHGWSGNSYIITGRQ